MQVFLSWSGKRSLAVAQAFHEWLPLVIQATRPWMSSGDIRAGKGWLADVRSRLSQGNLGILCLTPESWNAPWILFEAGALSKVTDSSKVIPFLTCGLTWSDVDGPLTMFQGAVSGESGVMEILKSINEDMEEPKLSELQLAKLFEMWWPQLETKLDAVEASDPPDDVTPKRAMEDKIDEILTLARLKQVGEITGLIPSTTISLESLARGSDIGTWPLAAQKALSDLASIQRSQSEGQMLQDVVERAAETRARQAAEERAARLQIDIALADEPQSPLESTDEPYGDPDLGPPDT